MFMQCDKKTSTTEPADLQRHTNILPKSISLHPDKEAKLQEKVNYRAYKFATSHQYSAKIQ